MCLTFLLREDNGKAKKTRSSLTGCVLLSGDQEIYKQEMAAGKYSKLFRFTPAIKVDSVFVMLLGVNG